MSLIRTRIPGRLESEKEDDGDVGGDVPRVSFAVDQPEGVDGGRGRDLQLLPFEEHLGLLQQHLLLDVLDDTAHGRLHDEGDEGVAVVVLACAQEKRGERR